MDDICEEEDKPLINKLVEVTSGIDHGEPKHKRPFQYAEIEDDEILAVFEKENWREGRFGDGKHYGVWYGAEKEITTVYESCWIAYKLGLDNVLQKGEVYTVDRAMYKAKVDTLEAIDLTKDNTFRDQLIHPTDYQFCQNLGRTVYREGQDLIRTLSARMIDEVCTPIFSPNAIKATAWIYYLNIHCHPTGLIAINSTHLELNFTLNFSQLANPYNIPLGS